MKRYLYIGIGGVLGAIFRYVVKNIYVYGYQGTIPLNTLAINVSGSFLLAFLLTFAFEILDFNIDVRIGIGTGFLGAFTTFSTMCKEAVTLMRSGKYYSAISYLGLSTILGLAAAYLGLATARKMVAKFINKKTENVLNEIGISKAKEED